MAILALGPALPLHTAGVYVAAAYVIVFTIVLLYVVIMAVRLRRMERSLDELARRTQRGAPEESTPA